MLFQQRNPSKLNHHNHQAGVVIVVALFIVALIATMAYLMMARLARDTHRTTLLVQSVQEDFYAQGSLAWAIDRLRNDWDKPVHDQLIDRMPLHSPIDKINGYTIESTVEDMQGRFNINNIINTEAQEDFKRLLHAVVPTLTSDAVEALTQSIRAWMIPGDNRDLDNAYLALTPPYRPAHRLMVSISEMRLVKGMTAAIYNALAPYCVALPTTTQINVQSAAWPVLLTLSSTMTPDAAKAIVALREEKPFISTEYFMSLDIVKNHGISANKVTVVSNYFLVETIVDRAGQRGILYTLLERTVKENKATINRIWQSKGVWL